MTNGKGADKVISANPSTATQQPALEMVKKGGLVVFFGGVPKGAMTELDTNLIHYNNIWIKGHFGASYMQSKKAFDLAISPEFDASKFVTHRLPLEDITKGIELTRTEAIKVVLFPNGMNPDEEAKELSDIYGMPCHIDNDVKSATRAERVWGFGQISKNFNAGIEIS